MRPISIPPAPRGSRPYDIKISYVLTDGRTRRTVRKVMASRWELAVDLAIRGAVLDKAIPADAVVRSIRL